MDPLSDFVGGRYMKYITMGCIMYYWKVSGCVWSAAHSLALVLSKREYDWRYLLMPYVSGHLFLYGAAMVCAILRKHVRAKLARREFFGAAWKGIDATSIDKKKLRHVFDRMNMSGDGRLNLNELHVALRTITGNDISLGDATMVRCRAGFWCRWRRAAILLRITSCVVGISQHSL